ncbi:MAG: putative Lycopene cyclase [Myxococcaceae bacterium]|nr:putative Lycopene cyclase [Myxococcaceae bacterium]
MSGAQLDLVLVGGGLANGLLASRLRATRPDLSFVLLEAGPMLGGNHTWSFHGTDLGPGQRSWLEPICAMNWHSHDVLLPGVKRTIGGGYHSIRSADFDRHLREELGDRVRTKCPVAEVGATWVVLGSGERLEARAVIDGRGAHRSFPCGYQKFLGQDLILEAPHGLQRPLLMDATVEQIDGYRFVYVLPWSEHHVLVEDTYYSDTPELDLPALRARISAWVAARGWKVAQVVREEAAALPIPVAGDPPVLDRPMVGLGAGLFHATTGYSLPVAADVAERICAAKDLSAPALTALLGELARRHWEGQRFFRTLNRMMFRGARPTERVRIFSSFYKHDEAMIGRFYAGKLTVTDKLAAMRRGVGTMPALAALKSALS